MAQIVECANCFHMFRDDDDTGQCARCGRENEWATDEFDDFIPARKVVG